VYYFFFSLSLSLCFFILYNYRSRSINKKKFRVHRRHPKQAKTTTKTTHRVGGGEKKWEVVVEISFALLIPLAILLT
jgi:hypothetical protein